MYFNYEHCSPFRMCNVIKARLNVIEQFEPLWRNETTMRFKHNQRFPLHFRPSRNNQRKHFPNSRCNSARLNMALNFFLLACQDHMDGKYMRTLLRVGPHMVIKDTRFFFYERTRPDRCCSMGYLCLFIHVHIYMCLLTEFDEESVLYSERGCWFKIVLAM